LRISSIQLKNFRCYYGQQDPLDLSTTPTAKIVLVFGENMKGKTSLLQAIRWCLYGRATDRQGREIPLVDPETKEQLLSRDAESEGDFSLAVNLVFQHDDAEYLLRREAVASGPPSSDAEFLITKELKSGTRVFPESSIDPYLQNILSEDVSRFFFFDAEMLEDYEDLLKNPEQEAAAVKQAIEKILGLPALRVYPALQELATESEQLQNAYLRKREKHAALLEEVGRLDNAIRAKKSDIAELEVERTKLLKDTAAAELAVKQNADIASKISQKGILESQIEEQQNRLEGAEDAIADLVHRKWWLPVVQQVAQRLENLRAERARAMVALQDLHWLERLQESTRAKRCALCQTSLDHSALKRVQDEATRLKLTHYSDDMSALLDTVRRADTYEKFNSQDALMEVRMRQEVIAGAEIAIGELETRIDEISASMVGRAYGDYNAKYERWQRLRGQCNKVETIIGDEEGILLELAHERTKKQTQLNKLPDANPALAFKTAVCRFLAELFESAVDGFRDSLRETVGADASEIFKTLTTEPAYQGLRIDENYGLALLDSNGQPVPGRSAGAEQIVALSLIGGLNRAAVREGPVVMDSNFARLDQGHRKNVIRFLPQLGPQVVVLVHSGEIDKDRDLDEPGVNIARRYEVVRVTETRSRIVPEAV